jgi:serine/threonine protein kinase
MRVTAAATEDAEHVCLVDFGLASSASDDLSISGAGRFIGTACHTAPEQIAGQVVDGRTDGYVLYECLSGRPPFRPGPTRLCSWPTWRRYHPGQAGPLHLLPRIDRCLGSMLSPSNSSCITDLGGTPRPGGGSVVTTNGLLHDRVFEALRR